MASKHVSVVERSHRNINHLQSENEACHRSAAPAPKNCRIFGPARKAEIRVMHKKCCAVKGLLAVLQRLQCGKHIEQQQHVIAAQGCTADVGHVNRFFGRRHNLLSICCRRALTPL